MAGTMTFPALLPALFAQWGIGNVEAGWINGVFHGGYGVTAKQARDLVFWVR
jgi:hypothetical protein